MAWLANNTRFDHTSEKVSRPMTANDFGSTNKWTTMNHFRTSYRDMSFKEAAPGMTVVIPGYQGFMPGNAAGSLVGRTAAQASRNCFLKQDALKKKEFHISKGFLENQTKFDKTRPATCHKYGKSSITAPTENLADPWTTTQRLCFRKPNTRTKPNTRQNSEVVFDSSMQCTNRPQTQASGFVQNDLLLDGAGWVPDPKLHTDQIRTSYRNAFCKPKPFHKETLHVNNGRLKRKQVVYDKKDFRKVKFGKTTTGTDFFNPYFT